MICQVFVVQDSGEQSKRCQDPSRRPLHRCVFVTLHDVMGDEACCHIVEVPVISLVCLTSEPLSEMQSCMWYLGSGSCTNAIFCPTGEPLHYCSHCVLVDCGTATFREKGTLSIAKARPDQIDLLLLRFTGCIWSSTTCYGVQRSYSWRACVVVCARVLLSVDYQAGILVSVILFETIFCCWVEVLSKRCCVWAR